MYPGARGSAQNHKRFCSDGVAPSRAHELKFPQPNGVFHHGNTLNVPAFFRAVQELFQLVCIEGETRADLSMELDTFAEMFHLRCKKGLVGGADSVGFKLFDGMSVDGVPSPEDYIATFNGQRYLKVLCL